MTRGRALAVALLLAALPANAQLPPNGEAIRTHDYTIDLAQTPVLAGSRVTGLAGAYVAIGEGVDGIAQNPGAVALRTPWSRDHIDYDLGFGFTTSSIFTRSDVFNSGNRGVFSQRGDESLVFLNLAGNLQIGRWGFGLSSDIQEYSLERTANANSTQRDRLVARFAVTHVTIGYALHRSEILVGLGARWSALNVLNANAPPGAEENLFGALGSGVEAGVLLRPNDAPYRVGVCLRSPVRSNASPTSSLRVAYAGDPDNELYLPDSVTLPWELNVGFALQLGPRPFNPRWLDPAKELEPVARYVEWRARERERRRRHFAAVARTERHDPDSAIAAFDAELQTEAALDALFLERAQRELDRRLRERYSNFQRFHVLLSGSVDILGRVDQAVGIESFLERKVQRSGATPSYSPRLGVETEAIPNWLRVRAGSYIEPTRFPDNPRGDRTHFTFGFDQRVLPWEVFGLWAEGSIWKLSGSLDVADAYFSWGIAIGMWH